MRTMRPFLRFSTGVDWHHRHLVNERKFPEIYTVYFTGSYSLKYSALLYYLLLIAPIGDHDLDLVSMLARCLIGFVIWHKYLIATLVLMVVLLPSMFIIDDYYHVSTI